MRILVITSCTGEKAVFCEDQLTLADFRQGPKHITQREQGLEPLSFVIIRPPAESGS